MTKQTISLERTGLNEDDLGLSYPQMWVASQTLCSPMPVQMNDEDGVCEVWGARKAGECVGCRKGFIFSSLSM